ncbi:hypothetical protein COL5a_007455 [Colletotrichum fioriniae]|uniref:uncharacterized protein n=1 Tax=Colletotrichum fioriniae TaxID=710243 RepID=UPI0032D9D307|nr:hypothetical protein COL5a_007455 [Colletotrichum fioriniae]KAJ3942928.1 hypothetical protein N0V96_007159 [Colletotrichum fioriniae]
MAVPQRIAPSTEALREFYVGKDVNDVPKPAVVLDAAKVRAHCRSMLEAVDELGVGFRFHVKTHKTSEVTKLQAGEKATKINCIVSTVAEIEHLLPTFKEYQHVSRHVNVLYGVPLLGSQIERLALLSQELGKGGLTVLVDHPSQLDSIRRLHDLSGLPVGVYLKVDTGYHRAGLPATALNKGGLLEQLTQLDAEGKATLVGLYSHSSLSYKDDTADQAMHNLAGEIEGCLEALHANESLLAANTSREITISVGASPQVTAIENLTGTTAASGSGEARLRTAIGKVQDGSPTVKSTLELHAGVYAFLDMQQMSTRSRTALGSHEDEVAISVVAEVCSVYNDGERGKPEALVAVGVLGLGREPCPSYPGWGVIERQPGFEAAGERRLIVDRISQEHAILSWEADAGANSDLPQIPLEVGQSVSIYPNHACVTGALYGWYLVVDSSKSNKTEIVDVWVRGSGW